MRIIILVLMAASLSASAGEIYKCEAEAGVVYKDQPCKTVDSQLIKQQPAPSSDSVDEAKQRAESEKNKEKELEENRAAKQDASSGSTSRSPSVTSSSDEGGTAVGEGYDRVRPIPPYRDRPVPRPVPNNR